MSTDPARAAGMPWWRGATIYQVYPRSFQDSNDDGVGDLPGITRRLEHLVGLGVDALWISPFYRSPMKDFGYDVSDYRDVDPLFGTLADFDRLLEQSHRRGLRVVIDQVLNHTSDQHDWFRQSRSSRIGPKADWYVWADPKPDGSPPNNWLSVFGGPAWQWDPRRRQYYLHNFLASQPDLNFHCPAVQEAVVSDLRFWLDRGVDGFRLDAANYYFHDQALRDNPPAREPGESEQPAVNPYALQKHLYDKSRPEVIPLLRRLRAVCDGYPDVMTLGEIGDGARSLELMASYSAGGDTLDTCYATDFLRGPFDPGYFRRTLERFEAGAGDGWPCWAFSNHDAVRHVSRWTSDGRDPVAVATFAAGLLLTLRGTVCLYQGEELGLPEAELDFDALVDPYGIAFWPDYKGRDGCRTPMAWAADAAGGAGWSGGFTGGRPWLPLPAAHRPLAADRQEGDPGSVLSVYRRMLAFRRNQAALRVGSIRFIDAPDGLLAFVRQHRDEAWLCLFNFSGNPVRFDLPCAGADRTADPVRAPADGAAVHPFRPLPAAGSVTLEPLGVGLGPTWIRGREADGPAASAGRRENASGVWHPPHRSR